MTPLEQAAYKAMQDAVAAGKSEADIVAAGATDFWLSSPTLPWQISFARARALYDQHFKVMGPN